MVKKVIPALLLSGFLFSTVQQLHAQEPAEEGLVAPQGMVEETMLESAEEGFTVPQEMTGEIPEESAEEGFVVEEEVIEEIPAETGVFEFVTEQDLEIEEEYEQEVVGEFITTDRLSPDDVKPAISFYIHSDITRKFTGLITNLKLERIYGVYQDQNTVTAYFDYSYTSVRNRDNVIMDKGKMTFIKFNSGKWFNEELSIYLKDKYKSYRQIMIEKLKQREAE
jgi:hypothetical protein